MGVEVGETVCYTVATQSEPWSGRTAQEYAEKTATRYMACEFGYEPPMPEFVRKGNNAYYPNPKYGTGFRNPGLLAGSTAAVIRVVATDGFNTGFAESTSFPVPTGTVDLVIITV